MAARVSIVMGSDSDLPVMAKAAKTLEEFGIGYEMRVISAHRTPDEMIAFGRGARERGIEAVISGAGMAAALPGMLAALTTLPVIGVPIYSRNLGGVDALYAVVQTPPGVPVATVAIDGAVNAALLAVRILAASDAALAEKLEAYMAKATAGVGAKDQHLGEVGWKTYLEEKA
ncbi:MAG: 5-(carboxyamino)imidazole ribonucleotide mutase [Lachnospiraceae bacterium]|nr:5-(carboxyamino)imidazole ribonucleotide mutase [Lachnospiraceae bacterium]